MAKVYGNMIMILIILLITLMCLKHLLCARQCARCFIYMHCLIDEAGTVVIIHPIRKVKFTELAQGHSQLVVKPGRLPGRCDAKAREGVGGRRTESGLEDNQGTGNDSCGPTPGMPLQVDGEGGGMGLPGLLLMHHSRLNQALPHPTPPPPTG